MELKVYRRGDGRMVVVPSLYQQPVALRQEGPLTSVALVDVDLLSVSDALIETMGVRGYAVVDAQDQAVLFAAM